MDFKELEQVLEQDLTIMSPRERAYALAEKIKVYREYGLKNEEKKKETDVEKAIRMMRSVSFLTTQEEKEMYAGALLAAIRWGKEIDRINLSSQKIVIEQAGGAKPEKKEETQEERRERIRRNFEKSVELQGYFKNYNNVQNR